MSMHHLCTALYCGFAARKLVKEGWGELYRDGADLPITVLCSRAEGKDVRIFCTGRVCRLIKGLQISREKHWANPQPPSTTDGPKTEYSVSFPLFAILWHPKAGQKSGGVHYAKKCTTNKNQGL